MGNLLQIQGESTTIQNSSIVPVKLLAAKRVWNSLLIEIDLKPGKNVSVHRSYGPLELVVISTGSNEKSRKLLRSSPPLVIELEDLRKSKNIAITGKKNHLRLKMERRTKNLGRRSGAVARDLAERLGPESSRDELVLALNHCASAGDLEQGRQIHAKITQRRLRSSAFLANHLIKMYGDCGDATSALAVFARLKRRNVFSWNLAIAACGGEDLSMGLYRSMLLEGQLPDNITFVNLIAGRSRSLEEGKAIHKHAVESGSIADVVVATAMVSLYGRLDQIAEAKKLFDAMPEKNQVSWTAMITAYARNGYRSEESIELYFQMTRIHALDPDRVTFIALLESCTSGSLALRDGAVIEQEIVARGLEGEPSIAVALVTMFARCGGIDSARIAFDRACHCKNIGSAAWTAMVAAYAQHGHLELAVEIHRLMALDGQDCDSVTFVNLLFACSHAGRLHDAWKCFASMSGDFWVESVLDHYVCVVDLLGRLGKLEEAEDLATNMPFEPVESVWMSFLSAILCSLE